MPDLRSALTSRFKTGAFGNVHQASPGLTIKESPVTSLVQLAGWENFENDAETIFSELGLPGLGDYRTVTKVGDISCARIAPDRLLLRGVAYGQLAQRCEALEMVALDLSHARTAITLSGPDAENVLARLAAVDFGLEQFHVGQFIQTGIHHVGVFIQRLDDQSFEVVMPSTWAASLYEFLTLTAEPFGYSVVQ